MTESSRPFGPQNPAEHVTRRSSGARAARRTLRSVGSYQGFTRVRETAIFALQCAIAAGIALWVAENIFHHDSPFFAPIAAIISLGIQGGKRIRRSFELVLGAALGIGVGDAVILAIGGGYWQVAVVVFAAIIAATFVDRGVMVAIQSASSAVLIATIIPPGSSAVTDRMVDALVGGAIGLLVLATVPNSPLRAARREISTLLSLAALVLDDVAGGLSTQDPALVAKALTRARNSQSSIDGLLAAAGGGSEVVNLSPMYWSARRHSKTMMRILQPVDHVMRNARVLARRAEILVNDGTTVTPELIRLIRGISSELGHLGEIFAEGGTRGTREEAVEIPEVVRKLQRLGSRATLDLAEGSGMSGMVVLAQCRSIIVDTLQVCGFSRESAMATLAPTVERPWIPPELH